jgi:hypothetical protein
MKRIDEYLKNERFEMITERRESKSEKLAKDKQGGVETEPGENRKNRTRS